jgi:AraC family transcriptional activator of pobA
MRIGIIPDGAEWKNQRISCTFGEAMERIPSFLLYGEQPQGAESPFVHIETIASRSRSLDWHIGAHRHDALSHVLLIKDGGGRFRLDGVERNFGSSAVLSVPSKMVHGFDFLPETDGLVLTLSDSLLSLARDALVEAELAGELTGPMLINLAEDHAAFTGIASLLERIGVELAQPQVGQLSAIRTLIAQLLLAMLRGSRFHVEASPYSSQDLRLVENLRRRIGASLAEAPTVGDLAAELGVTAARLNAACRRIAGCSTLHLLHAALLAEAKRALLYTEQPVSEVAYSLGFEDPAYFSRFFSRRTGRTPSAFRAQHIPVG